MPAADMPAAEIDIDIAMVRALLEEQHPDLAARSIVEVACGWDNVIFRLGDDLAVRLPRRQLGAALVAHELRWLPLLAPRLPLPIPAPVRAGRPSAAYPWEWTVVPWFAGSIAAATPPADPEEAALALGRFVAALHQVAPADAPANPFRGVPLAARAESMELWLERMAGEVDARAVRARWSAALDVPQRVGPPLWIHGDLHPANVLVDGGAVSAVIDFGDLTAGDPATDLAGAWSLLPASARATFRAEAGEVDDATWARAEGWALLFGMAYLANSADHPLLARVGRTMLVDLLA